MFIFSAAVHILEIQDFFNVRWLLAKVVGEEHFGGFLTKVDSSTNDEKKKSWKEKMEEIISKSKKAKVYHFVFVYTFVNTFISIGIKEFATVHTF